MNDKMQDRSSGARRHFGEQRDLIGNYAPLLTWAEFAGFIQYLAQAVRHDPAQFHHGTATFLKELEGILRTSARSRSTAGEWTFGELADVLFQAAAPRANDRTTSSQ